MKSLFSKKKIWILLGVFVLAVAIMSVGSVFAKYLSTLEAGSFHLELEPVERAYIVYSEDDYSLEIFKGLDIPKVGEKSRRGKTVTKVYHDRIEYIHYTFKLSQGQITSDSVIPAWHEISSKVKTVTFIDTVSPLSTSGWFYGFSKVTEFDLTKLDTSNTIDMSGMFRECSSLTAIDLSCLDTSKNERLGSMFFNCTKLTDITFGENFDTSNVGSFGDMFSGCSALKTVDLSSFTTESATYLGWMFTNCVSLTSLDLSTFKIPNTVTGMDGMFWGCGKLTTVYVTNEFVTTSVTNSENMFQGCNSLVGGNGTKFSSSQKNKTYARIDGANGLHGYFTAKDDTTVTYANVTVDITALGNGYTYSFTNTKQEYFFLNDANSITLIAEEGVTLPTEVTLTCGENSETATVTTDGVVVIPATLITDGATITISAVSATPETPSEDTTEPEENGGAETASTEQESTVSEETTSPENIATDPVLSPSEGSEDAENGTEQTEGQQDQE